MEKLNDAFFSALAEPTRRNIVEVVADKGQLGATAIAGRFQITPSAISQHLKILKKAGLLVMEKQGQKRLYRINPGKMTELSLWAEKMAKQWNERFDRLDEVLATEKKKILKTYRQNKNN